MFLNNNWWQKLEHNYVFEQPVIQCKANVMQLNFLFIPFQLCLLS